MKCPESTHSPVDLTHDLIRNDFGSLCRDCSRSLLRLAHFVFTHQQGQHIDLPLFLFGTRRLHEAKRAALEVDPSTVDDVGGEVLEVHRILGLKHLAGANGVQDAGLILGEIGFQHLDRFLGLLGIAG